MKVCKIVRKPGRGADGGGGGSLSFPTGHALHKFYRPDMRVTSDFPLFAYRDVSGFFPYLHLIENTDIIGFKLWRFWEAETEEVWDVPSTLPDVNTSDSRLIGKFWAAWQEKQRFEFPHLTLLTHPPEGTVLCLECHTYPVSAFRGGQGREYLERI